MYTFFSSWELSKIEKKALSDVIYGFDPDVEGKEAYNEMARFVGQCNYRKEFGLSWEEFVNEPSWVYNMNMMILYIQGEKLNSKSNKKG